MAPHADADSQAPPPQYTLMPIQIAKGPYLLGCGPLYCLRSEMMGCATSLAIEIDLSALGFGELCVERVILELKALDLLGSAAAYEQPGAVDGCCHECTGQHVGTLGKDAGALGVLEG